MAKEPRDKMAKIVKLYGGENLSMVLNSQLSLVRL